MREEFSCVAIVADSGQQLLEVESKIGTIGRLSRSNRVRIILPTFQMLVQDAGSTRKQHLPGRGRFSISRGQR